MARWWPWGGATADSASAGSAAPQANPTPDPAPTPVQRAAWQDLPPLQRTVTPTPPIAPLSAFTASLATAHDPSFLAPLGHIVDPDGPSGHVDGLARPEIPHTISTGPELTVAPPRKRSPITSAVQRLIEPRVRFTDPTAATTVADVQRSAEFTVPAVAPTPDPAVDLGSDDPAAVPGDSMPARMAWSLPTVPAAAPPVRMAPLLSAPQQPPVTSLPVVAAPVPMSASVGSTSAPAASAPAVQRLPDDGGPTAASEAGSAEETGALPTAPLAGQTSMPIVSRVTDDGPTTASRATDDGPTTASRLTDDGSTTGGAPAGLASAPELPPAVGPVPRPAVQRSATTRDAAPASAGSAAGSRPAESSSPATAPLPDPTPAPDPTSAPDLAPASAPARATAPLADSVPDAPLTVAPTLSAPTLSAPTLSAPTGSVGSPGAPAVQRYAESSSPTSTDRPAAPPVRGSGLGAPLTAVPSRPRETVVHEPQAMDFASIMRIIDSAAATGSTEISLPSAPSAQLPDVAPTRPVAPTLGDPGRPARPSGLGAPLMSGGAPAVQRSVPTPQSPGSGPVESGTSLQRTPAASAGVGPIVPRHPDVSAGVPRSEAAVDGVGTAPQPGTPPDPALEYSAGAAATVGEAAGDVGDSVVAPTLGVEAHEAPEARGSDGDAHEAADLGLPQLPLAGTAPVQRLDAGPSVQRLAADPTPTPAAPLMMAPLLGDTSPYRSTPMHPAVPAAPGVSAGPVLPTASAAASTAASAAAPAVQRFGLPGASSLLDSAKKSVGGLASSAQGAVGGLRDQAGGYVNQAQQAAGGYVSQAQGAAGGLMNSARGYADQAQQAAGGYANQAQQAAGGYLNQAQGAAGGLMDSARGYAEQAQGAAGGYLNQAQGAAGGLADSAAGYLRSAQGAASNAAGSATQAIDNAVGSASSAASGAANQLQGAASGGADQASGAVGQATGALSHAASGVTDAVSGAAGGAMHAATGAIGAAAGAAGAAAAGAASEALPTNLDELARRLFDPLSARLKSELWMDRERAGMVTDLRR